MALIYQSASILRTLSLGLITIFGFVALFFVSAPKLWTGTGGLLTTDRAHADTPHNCDTGGLECACGCGCAGCGGGCACGSCGGGGPGGGTGDCSSCSCSSGCTW